MKLFVLLILLVLSFQAFASMNSRNLKEFCHDRESLSFVTSLAHEPENLMAFRNSGGIADLGICWWHSRFQRNALYLTYYDPHAPKPNRQEAHSIILRLRHARRVVKIPGFRNFQEFTRAHSSLIKSELEDWQKFDGIFLGWMRGLQGQTSISASDMKIKMDNLYQDVYVKGHIVYQMLQLKGLTAHSWLVVGMKKYSNGYDLKVVDSNLPSQTKLFEYRYGDRHLKTREGKAFTPYTQRTSDINQINRVIRNACRLI